MTKKEIQIGDYVMRSYTGEDIPDFADMTKHEQHLDTIIAVFMDNLRKIISENKIKAAIKEIKRGNEAYEVFAEKTPQALGLMGAVIVKVCGIANYDPNDPATFLVWNAAWEHLGSHFTKTSAASADQ